MPNQNPDLHGNVPDQCTVALLIIDMISDFAFEGGDRLLAATLPVAEAGLKRRARAAEVPVVYVNDNYGKWRSDFQQQVNHVLADTPGRPVAERLRPDPDDYFVLKPKHSGFYATPLGLLLDYLGAKTLVLTGVRTESCVLFTANDAYMREFHLVVPPDGVATFNEDHETALRVMERDMGARLLPCAHVDFDALRG
ncbi:MAG: cysteine hydrolase family protein [Candidatus Sericytochromatia bacterium]